MAFMLFNTQVNNLIIYIKLNENEKHTNLYVVNILMIII